MISIIVPVYNVEKYLQRCIESILAQTFADFELLLIDDGSKDKSGDICDEYAATDCRIRVFHKENGGVSSARNLGIEHTKGEWITFIDSDDWVEPDYLANFSMDSDLCVQGNIVNDNKYCYEPKLFIQDIAANYLLNHYVYGPYCKLFKANIIHSNNVSFDQTLAFGEDILFCINYAMNCSSMQVVCKAGYHYEMYHDGCLTAASRDYTQSYNMYLKHLQLFEKCLCSVSYGKRLMRKYTFLAFSELIEGHYAFLMRNQEYHYYYSKYLIWLDKIVLRLFVRRGSLYYRCLSRMNLI